VARYKNSICLDEIFRFDKALQIFSVLFLYLLLFMQLEIDSSDLNAMDCNFDENRSVKFEIFKILKTFEINNSKKPVYFKIFDQNRIQKFKVTRPRKFGKVKMLENHEKRKLSGFSKNHPVFVSSVFLKIIQFPISLSTAPQNISSQTPNVQAMWVTFVIFDGI
jgi:hypothetical protein